MKKANKAVALLLFSVLLFTLLIPAFAVEKSGKDVPNVHIRGMAGDIVDVNDNCIDEREFPEGGLAGMVKDCMPSFLNALVKNTDEAWDDYRAKLFPAVLSCFGSMWLNNNGEATDGSHQRWDWDHENLSDTKNENGYGFDSYPFIYDWRLDPFAIADLLHEYILRIKEITGSDKVNVNARCEGANVMLAYFAKYGYGDFNCVEFYAAASGGSELADALFSGHIQTEGDALARYVDQKFELEDELTNELVEALLVFACDTHLLKTAELPLDLLFKKLYVEVIAPLVLQTYGTFPGFWAMVSPEYYKDARKGIFGGKEAEYAGLIEKTDHYDRDVRQCIDKLMLGAKDAGVKVAVFAKYGDYQVPPVTRNANEISDNTLTLRNTSFGATSSKYGCTLSKLYLAKAKLKGTDQYISPDKMVDASTCLFPDTTWFIWDCPHETFPDYIFEEMAKFYCVDGDMTVFSDPTLPQYVIAHPDPDDGERGTLEPMTRKNAPVIESSLQKMLNGGWLKDFVRLLKAVGAFLADRLKNR